MCPADIRPTKKSNSNIWHKVIIAITILSFPGLSSASTTTISGLLEAEMGLAKDYNGNNSSDITLATVELAVDAEISEWFIGHILFLHEEGETDLEVDEGYIIYGNPFQSKFSILFGQQYIPFGVFETNLISDPLTLAIGETRESAIVIRYDGSLYASFYLFNGDMIETGGDDTLDNMGVSAGYNYQGENIVFDAGFGYINNIKDTDGLTAAIVGYREIQNDLSPGLFPIPQQVDEYVAGFTGHMVFNWGSTTFIGEVVAALKDFVRDELYNNKPARPSAANLEFAYGISDALTVALAYQGTVDLAGYLPETRLLLGLSYQFDEATSFAFEIANDTDYTIADGGSGETASTTTFQLATQF